MLKKTREIKTIKMMGYLPMDNYLMDEETLNTLSFINNDLSQLLSFDFFDFISNILYDFRNLNNSNTKNDSEKKNNSQTKDDDVNGITRYNYHYTESNSVLYFLTSFLRFFHFNSLVCSSSQDETLSNDNSQQKKLQVKSVYENEIKKVKKEIFQKVFLIFKRLTDNENYRGNNNFNNNQNNNNYSQKNRNNKLILNNNLNFGEYKKRLREKGVFEIANLIDICYLYSHYNRIEVEKLLKEVFENLITPPHFLHLLSNSLSLIQSSLLSIIFSINLINNNKKNENNQKNNQNNNKNEENKKENEDENKEINEEGKMELLSFISDIFVKFSSFIDIFVNIFPEIFFNINQRSNNYFKDKFYVNNKEEMQLNNNNNNNNENLKIIPLIYIIIYYYENILPELKNSLIKNNNNNNNENDNNKNEDEENDEENEEIEEIFTVIRTAIVHLIFNLISKQFLIPLTQVRTAEFDSSQSSRDLSSLLISFKSSNEIIIKILEKNYQQNNSEEISSLLQLIKNKNNNNKNKNDNKNDDKNDNNNNNNNENEKWVLLEDLQKGFDLIEKLEMVLVCQPTVDEKEFLQLISFLKNSSSSSYANIKTNQISIQNSTPSFLKIRVCFLYLYFII